MKRALICHERFLPRFGADRVLIIIGRQLVARGWTVDFMGHQFPDDQLQGVARRRLLIPAPSEYLHFDVETTRWVGRWLAGPEAAAYDLVVIGGWPFFGSIPLFREKCGAVLFIDCGVVPNDGYDPGTQRVLDHLRELRRNHLSQCTHIAANSRFTLESQTLPEVGAGPECRAVLNGIDHLAEPGARRQFLPSRPLALLRGLRSQGRKPVLLLGRFEKTGYKNSLAGLEVCRILRRADPAVTLLVLDRPEALALDWELQGHVHGLGFPDDQGLTDLMAEVEVGLSVSLWEGFNLPIAEMYRLGRPALCFDLAAHPEVVLRTWFLCRDVTEMAAKAALILCGASARGRIAPEEAADYRARFTWNRFMQQLIDLTGV